MRYVNARLETELKSNEDTVIFRYYISSAVQAITNSCKVEKSLLEITEEIKKPKDNRSGDEIAADIMLRHGLKFKKGDD